MLDCTDDLKDYVFKTEDTEEALLRYLKGPPGDNAPLTGGPAPKSLSSSTGNFRGSIAASKDGTNVSLTNDFPLSRTKKGSKETDLEGKPLQQRAIARNLTLGLSATFEEGKSGFIGDFSDLSDKPLGVSVGFNMQYYPWRPAKPVAGGTLLDIGQKKVSEIVALCRAEQQKKSSDVALRAEIFGSPSTPLPDKMAGSGTTAPSIDPCRFDNLLNWVFATNDDGTFKRPVAIDTYNAAFWATPEKDELPKYGFGVTAKFTRQRFASIDPANFGPDIVVPGANPPLLSTLDSDALGEVRKVRYDWLVSGYGFFHRPIDWKVLEGLTVIGRIGYGREWNIEKAAKGVEFCAIDGTVTTPGANNRTCKKFNVGPPNAESGFEIGTELRTKLPLTRLHRYLPEIGLAPSLSYSDIEDRYRLISPFFVAFDKDRGLNGGLQVAHEWGGSEDRETVISIFYSTPFTLAGNK